MKISFLCYLRRQYWLLTILLLAGCASPAHDVTSPVGHGAPTVAVILGVKDEVNREIAMAVAASLQRQSRQQIMTDGQIAKRLANYPLNIQGPYTRAYFEIEEDWNRTDMTKVTAIQQALGVDYLLVIWAPNVLQNYGYLVWTAADIKATGNDRVMVPLIVQLFATPGYKGVMKEKYMVCLDGSNKPKKVFMDGCESVDKIALALGKETGLIKGWW